MMHCHFYLFGAKSQSKPSRSALYNQRKTTWAPRRIIEMCIFKSFETISLKKLQTQAKGGRDSPLVVPDRAQWCSHDGSRRHGATECSGPLGGAVALRSRGTAHGGGARGSGVGRQGFLRGAGLLQLLAGRRTETFRHGHQVALAASEWPARKALCPRGPGGSHRRSCHVVFIFARVRS